MDAIRGHKKVLVDTSIWIYHFEQHPEFGAKATKILADVEAGRFNAVVSELTLMELIVRPLQLKRQDVADEYELLLNHFPNVVLAPVSRIVLVEAAALRAHFQLRTADSILLGTGLVEGATAAITNDQSWHKVARLKIVTLADMPE